MVDPVPLQILQSLGDRPVPAYRRVQAPNPRSAGCDGAEIVTWNVRDVTGAAAPDRADCRVRADPVARRLVAP